MHIFKDDNGNWKATLVRVDQGANGIPVTSISIQDSKLAFAVGSIHGAYEGNANGDGTAIEGTWNQGQPLPLNFRRAAVLPISGHEPAKPSDIDGAWLGAVDVGEMKLRIVFHISNTEDGLVATMDSPDQGATGLPVSAVTRNGSSFALEMKQIGGAFKGLISPDLTMIGGTWTQGGANASLTLKRVKNTSELELRRPQNPVKPYPYREEEVTFRNRKAGIELAATLTIPQGKGPFPAVVLIVGSGPHDRDESLLGHKPFLVLSDYLTRKGIAVLRADDRGVGKSGGKFATATTADLATDTEAAVAYLKTRPEAAPHRIRLIGHSEGGVIAPMVAARDPDVAFIVLLAGPGVPGDQIIVVQTLLISETNGMTEEAAEKNASQEREILAIVKGEKDDAAIEKTLREKLTGTIPEAQVAATIQQLTSPWFRYFIAYDPAPALRSVKCPVLALNGEKDLQVPPKQNLPAIRQALEAGGNKDFEVDELSGLNHLFQTAKTGSLKEYAEIEETMSPVALEKIAGWILER